MNIKDKIKVFISSKCGVEKYDIVREALKCRLEETGFIDTYVFETTNASSKRTIDTYLNKLDDCDLIIFLIDNEDEIFPEGVKKEYLRAKQLEKKSIYLFLNIAGKDETTIQKSLYGGNGYKFTCVNNIKEFISKGYESIIEDIFSIYKDYCKGRINTIDYIDDSMQENNLNLSESNNLVLDKIEEYQMKKSFLDDFAHVCNYFVEKNKFARLNKLGNITDKERSFLYFAKLLLCEEKFNEEEFNTLTTLIIKFHIDKHKDVIKQKLKAIRACYNNNLEEAIEVLDNSYDEGIKTGIEKWILKDILIDKRNLEALLCEKENEFRISEAQNILNKSDDMLYYPVLDRLSKEIYGKIIEEKNKMEMKGPYTSHIGTGIDSILSSIGKYFILAIYYGSYTHINAVKILLKDVFYNFYQFYNLSEWGFNALNYSVLTGNSTFIKDICDRNSNIISNCSMDKIEGLYTSLDNIDIEYNKFKFKIIAFKYLGYYFSDDYYIESENNIFTIFNKWLCESLQVNLAPYIFESILDNINRINIRKTVKFLLDILNGKHYRFYDEVLNLIKYIPSEKIEEEHIKELINKMEEILSDEERRKSLYRVKECLIYLKKIDNNAIDLLINKYWESLKEDLTFKISDNNEHYNLILKYLNEIKNRNNTQGKDGYSGYSYDPANIIKVILNRSDLKLLNKSLLENITEVCKQCLDKETQTITEKVSCLQLLMYLQNLSLEDELKFNWNDFYKSLNEEKILNGYSDIFFSKDSKLTLMTNFVAYKIINMDASETDLLKLLSYYNSNNQYEDLKFLECMQIFLSNSNAVKKEIYSILLQFIVGYIKNKRYEIRMNMINCLFKLVNKFSENSEYQNILYHYINISSNDSDYRIKMTILYNIKNQKEKISFKNIIENYLVDNNYLVRIDAKTLINKI